MHVPEALSPNSVPGDFVVEMAFEVVSSLVLATGVPFLLIYTLVMQKLFACTMDLAPITQRLSLGTLPNPDYTITANGELVD